MDSQEAKGWLYYEKENYLTDYCIYNDFVDGTGVYGDGKCGK